MNNFKVPPISPFAKAGLLISDTDVELVSWRKKEVKRVAVFTNDDAGLARFATYLEKNAKHYKNASFHVLANVIGEDYRLEKVAHLIGKYKTDFHNRRMQQLFRGVSLCMSFVQGREERGRREDIVLFYGMLTEAKVLPWMKVVTKNPTHYIAGVHPVSFINAELLKVVSDNWRKGGNLLMTLHEKGLLRQTHYDRGHVRFSRVSKIADESAEAVAGALRKELERTVQYLNSLKISIAQGLDIQFICPGNMVGQLRELVKGNEKIRFHFHDASAVAQSIGLEGALGELGRDSSLSLHLMFSRVWLRQLSSITDIRYYWMRNVSMIAAAVFIINGALGALTISNVGLNALDVRGQNEQLVAERDEIQRSFDEQFGQLEEPPSSPANIEAVAKTFRLLSQINIVPGQLIYYFAQAYEKNKRLQISDMRWYLTDTTGQTAGQPLSLIRGTEIYQILEVSGEFLAVPNESYIDVANRGDILIKSFEERNDIEVQVIDLPRRELVKENLGGTITDDYEVDAARSRTFRLRIIWKNYDEQLIDNIVNRRA